MKSAFRGISSTNMRAAVFLVIICIFSMIPAALSSTVVIENILKSPGARAAGFGGAFAAVADDYSAFFWNPAGLVLIDRMSATVSYDSVYKNSQTDVGFNFTYPLFETYTLAFSYFHTGYSGSIFSDDALYLTGSTYLDDKKMYALGVNFKFTNTSAADTDVYGSAGGIDIGVMVFPDILEKKIRFGFLVQNLDEVVIWNNDIKQRIPYLFKMGAAYSFDPTAVVSMDIDILQSEAGIYHSRTGLEIGGEKWFLNRIIGNFAARGGFAWREALDPNYKFTLGFSYGREDFVLDYVYILPVNSLGETHKINLSYFFGGRTAYKAPEIEIPAAAVNDADVALYAEKYRLVDLGISQKYLSPNNDGVMDFVEFTVKNKPADFKGIGWKLQITNQAGAITKELSGSDKVPESYIWRGDNNALATAADGDYTATFYLYAKSKEIWKKARVVTLDTTAPVFDIALYPKVFAPIKASGIKELTLDIKTKASDIKSWQLFIQDTEKHIIRKMSGDGFTGKLAWAGKDALDNTVKDGDYAAVIIMTDFAGNKYEQSAAFKVDTHVTRVKIIPDRRIFKPVKESVVFAADFGEPGRIKSWDFEIYADKALVKVYKNRTIAARKINWDGTDNNLQEVRAGSSYGYKATVRQKNEITMEQTGIIQTSLPEFKDAGIDLTLGAVDFAAGDRSIPASEYGYLNQASEAVKKYAKDYYLYIKAYSNDAGGPEENLALSIERAATVRDYLVAAGVPAGNVYIAGYGDGTYAAGAASKEIVKAGRRVEVELLTK
jgi:outer membrane protein OmpA-like peptidoglycan-associated protein